MGKFIDITGQKFGRLTAIERAGVDRYGKILWLFSCNCGNQCIALGNSVRLGYKKSCGCIAKENAIKLSKKNITHGLTGTRLFVIWTNMINRCYSPKNKFWHIYGGRGITVCDEWRSNPQAFVNWAIDNGYEDDLTIDRKNNNNGYSPDNCRWATQIEQANNQRSNRMITAFGKTKTAQQWADGIGIQRSTLVSRIDHGWTPESALSISIKSKGKKHATTS
ncbi:hypothetical protein Ga0466249_005252 [Sporomusaceae bacterium BoRhaA]|uniref:hypothetical protein n=1 Tax=Pelorhabdus rhamnosifermentans TaxID=2772457 RepID=UPI001C062DBA|nr:hypothetical protein [Pelorhabdus rhamnosifermentans]MBU2704099.1 hypothetical protein [Pelorhabdus rhamnosifermentans]